MILYSFWSSWPDLSFETHFVFFDFFAVVVVVVVVVAVVVVDEPILIFKIEKLKENENEKTNR